MLAAVLAGGCQAPQPPTGPTAAVLEISDYERFFDATLTTLRRYDLPPDRVDRIAGLIVSEPTTSAQWFELWRVDAPGGYQLLESSLHTVQRTVTVTLERDDGRSAGAPEPTAAEAEEPPIISGRYRVTVKVDKARRVSPERQITLASGALAIYSERVPTVEGERGPKSRHVQWVPLGRDGLLEAWLLEQIEKASPAAVVAVQPTPEGDQVPSERPVEMQ